MKKRILPILLVVVMMVALLPIAGASEQTKSPVGMSMAGFSTTDLYGNTVDSSILSQYNLTFVNFWATWCGPCTSEMPHIQQLYETYEPLGINVLGLLCEGNGCTPSSAASYCENNGITYSTIIPDNILTGIINNSGGYIPVSYVVNSEGEVLDYVVGSMSYSQMLEFVLPHFNPPDPESIAINPATATVEARRMVTLELEFTPASAKRYEATWTSSNEAVATVDGGVVTGLSEGTATITATLEEIGLTATAEITVTPTTGTPEYPFWAPATDFEMGKEYMVVVNYNGAYIAMTNEEAVNNRLQLKGYQFPVDDIYLGDEDILLFNSPENTRWTFGTNAENPEGMDIVSLDGDYISTVRNNGVYRLTLKSKSAIPWAYNDGKIEAMDKFTDERKYISYYADPDVGADANFDLLNADHENFIDIMLYELVTGEEPSYELGDVNMNGQLDSGDAAMVLRYTVDLAEMDDAQLALADFNEDGKIDTGDAALILRTTVGL